MGKGAECTSIFPSATRPHSTGYDARHDFYVNSDHACSTPAKSITHVKTYFLYTMHGEGTVSYDGGTFSASGNAFIVTLMNKSLQYAKCKSRAPAPSRFHSVSLMIVREANRPKHSANDRRLISQVGNYIRSNLSTVTVQALTDAFRIGPRTLRNLFNRSIGTTPKHFITKIRLEYAGNLLISTAFSLEQIAQQPGFSSQYHFSKAFKEFYGITPMYCRRYIHLMRAPCLSSRNHKGVFAWQRSKNYPNTPVFPSQRSPVY